MLCQPKISKNEITSNRYNGINALGYNNITRIEENENISFNKLAGIKVDNEANIVIMKNYVFKNIHQGILVYERSSAHMELNHIHENIKANVAFGGEGSCNNVLTNNTIFGGRCEGVFVIEGGYSLIHNNDIYENYDGIICCTATPQIENCTITRNKRNGIMVLKDGRPTIINCTIKGNLGAGLFIRDKSKGKYMDNTIRMNHIELIIERKTPELLKVDVTNKIEGDIRTPQTYKCTIM